MKAKSLEKKDKFIKVRVSKTQKNKLKELSQKYYGMNLSEFLLYGAMKLINEKEFDNFVDRVEK